MAGAIARGEVRLYRFSHPDKRRPVVVLTRESAIGYLSAVTVAPITSTIRGVPSEVPADRGGRNEGSVRRQSPQPRHGVQGSLGTPGRGAQLGAIERDLRGAGLHSRLRVSGLTGPPRQASGTSRNMQGWSVAPIGMRSHHNFHVLIERYQES